MAEDTEVIVLRALTSGDQGDVRTDQGILPMFDAFPKRLDPDNGAGLFPASDVVLSIHGDSLKQAVEKPQTISAQPASGMSFQQPIFS